MAASRVRLALGSGDDLQVGKVGVHRYLRTELIGFVGGSGSRWKPVRESAFGAFVGYLAYQQAGADTPHGYRVRNHD